MKISFLLLLLLLDNTLVDAFCNELVHPIGLVTRYFFFVDLDQILKFKLWQI